MSFVSYETKPTEEYGAYQRAFDHFNRHLFGNELPPCLLTFQRGASFKGYYWARIYNARNRKRDADEIAINPEAMDRSDLEILSTLAHEMCHHWQQHFGKPSRKAYHNREWAAKMQGIGLVPSDTGKPGGKQTGQNMTHYIAPEGSFARFAKQLIASGFALTWQSQSAAIGGKAAKKSSSKTKYTCESCGLNAWAKPGVKLRCGECEERMQEEE